VIEIIFKKPVSIIFVPVLRNIAVIPLLIAFAAQSFSGAFIRLGYAINPAAFAKYCVNKAKPRLQCNGKCQVMKKMKEEEKKEQDYKVTLLSSKSFFATVSHLGTPYKITYPRTTCSATVHRSLTVFHPPQV
jgi:hypothetical protein